MFGKNRLSALTGLTMGLSVLSPGAASAHDDGGKDVDS
jgi:hypothetical protein